MFQIPAVWVDNTPDSLLDIALRYCIKHQNVFCKFNDMTEEYDELLDDLLVPVGICERLLNLSITEISEDRFNRFITLFKDKARTHLRHLDLTDSVSDDHSLEILTRHNIAELNISNCKRLTGKCLPYIAKLHNSLISLNVGHSIQIFRIEEDNNPTEDFQPLDPRNEANQPSNNVEVVSELCLPFLRKLVINGRIQSKKHLRTILKSTEYLTYLDLSNCDLDCDDLECLSAQKQLTSLILCDVMIVVQCVPAICQLKSLRLLDISYTSEDAVFYPNPNEALKSIVESLENLVSLDISGTNLAGDRKRKSPESDFTEEEPGTDIPGLESRVNTPLEFLGLLRTAHEACHRHHIPAKRIAGNATVEQSLVAGQAYYARGPVIQKILYDFYYMFRYLKCSNTELALDVVMEAMRLHPKRKNIQAAGSASLYYIVIGGELKKFLNLRMRQKIVKLLLDGMCSHFSEKTDFIGEVIITSDNVLRPAHNQMTQINMLHNACLVLTNIEIPKEFYERLLPLLLSIIDPISGQDESLQRIGLNLFDSVVEEMDSSNMKLVGDIGTITTMNAIVKQRLENNICDEVMETAWSIMWNVTETPINCARFLEGGGMDLFLRCLQIFPEKPELLSNMIGLLSNVAAVKEQRHHLMKDEYLSVFRKLLESKTEGYYAAYILSHIASDEEEAWTRNHIVSVKRKDILKMIIKSIEKWDLDTKCDIYLSSFKPLFELLNIEHTPEVQLYAIWLTANLTNVYPEEHCSLLKEEGGIDILKKLLRKPGHSKILELAETIIKQCERYESGEIEDFDDRQEIE